MIDQDAPCNCEGCPLAVKGYPVQEVCGHSKRVGIGFCRERQLYETKQSDENKEMQK